MGDLVHLFGDGPPAAEQSDEVAEFCDEYMGDFLAAVTALDQATTLDEFRAAKQDVMQQVAVWPK